MTILHIDRAGPLTTIQDEGRLGVLRHGISASGPMDRASFELAGTLAGHGYGAVEISASGIAFTVSGECAIGFAGGDFSIAVNGTAVDWPGRIELGAGEAVEITPGSWGNYGYVRLDRDIALEQVLGSLSTSSRVGLGGLNGRVLRAGDRIALGNKSASPTTSSVPVRDQPAGPVRVIWGLHAELFSPSIRQQFLAGTFAVSSKLDRMGVKLNDPQRVFAGAPALSLVSDAMVPGDIQILGDGTLIVLMRDHQPTGGYPRIATVVTADFDRFAQMRPGSQVVFQSVTVEHAHRLLRSAL